MSQIENQRTKILAIVGSPRKGKTYQAIKSLEENSPEIDLNILMLNELDIGLCKGCYLCNSRGEEYCPLKDDRDTILAEMEKADGIIFASPVYVNHITGTMKNFIDRLGFLAHRPNYFDKQAMVMATCKSFGADIVTGYLEDIVNVFGLNVTAKLGLKITTGSEKEDQQNHMKAVKVFDEFIESIRKGTRVEPSINQLVMFNSFKMVSEQVKDEFPADYSYYKDKKGYYYEGAKINGIKKMLAKRIAKKSLDDLAHIS
jgi:multimeric flavodoxin WrbA